MKKLIKDKYMQGKAIGFGLIVKAVDSASGPCVQTRQRGCFINTLFGPQSSNWTCSITLNGVLIKLFLRIVRGGYLGGKSTGG